jgi:dTDP-4-dehydrorhamnose reductase
MNIILTGSIGFVGARVLYRLQGDGHDVTCIPSEMLKSEISGERLFSLMRLFSKAKPDVIVHTAAISSTGYSEKHPDEAYTANVMLPQVMAKLAVANKCKLISCSSDQVYYGCSGFEPHSENEGGLEPANVYGRHKLEAEKRILDICPDAVSLRLSWMYDLPVYQTKTNNNFMLSLMKSALTGKAGIFSVNDFRGITYVRSVAENILKTFNLPGGVYNYGSENDKNMYDTACDFMAEMGMVDRIPDLIQSTDTQPLRNLRMNCTKIQENRINFESTTESIKKMVADYQGLF